MQVSRNTTAERKVDVVDAFPGANSALRLCWISRNFQNWRDCVFLTNFFVGSVTITKVEYAIQIAKSYTLIFVWRFSLNGKYVYFKSSLLSDLSVFPVNSWTHLCIFKAYILINVEQTVVKVNVWDIAAINCNNPWCGAYGTSVWRVTWWMWGLWSQHIPDRKVRGANMGSIWGRQDPGGPNVGPHELSYLGGDHSETNIYSACTRVANGTIRQARVGRRLRERES